jgi:hypothetical protein
MFLIIFLSLPSGISDSERLGNISIAAYYCTGSLDSVPYLIYTCGVVLQGCWRISRHEPSAGRCMRCRGSEHVLPIVEIGSRAVVYSAQATFAKLLSVQVRRSDDTHSMCASNVNTSWLYFKRDDSDPKATSLFGQSGAGTSQHKPSKLRGGSLLVDHRDDTRSSRKAQTPWPNMLLPIVEVFPSNEWRLMKHSLACP